MTVDRRLFDINIATGSIYMSQMMAHMGLSSLGSPRHPLVTAATCTGFSNTGCQQMSLRQRLMACFNVITYLIIFKAFDFG